MRLLLLLLFPFHLCFAQTGVAAPPAPVAAAKPASSGSGKTSRSSVTAAQMQAALDQLTQSNHDLLDLLKKQQAVLEDMQFDRRLQSRQIESLEDRLEETLFENTQLQKKVARLEAEAAVRPSVPPETAPAAPAAPDSTNPPPGPVRDNGRPGPSSG